MEMDDRHDESMELAILKGSVENANEAFVTIDEKHKVLFFNRAAEKIFGYSQDEVLGHDLDIIIAPRCSSNHRRAVERYIETREPKLIGHATEILATRKDGEIFPAEISFSVADVKGKLYFTGIVRDMTETKAMLEQIARSDRLVALGKFVAEITHEIKNPLVTIGGFTSQVVKHTRDKKSIDKLNIVLEEVQRLENLLRELREFYLPRSLSSERIEINGLLRDVQALVKNDCRKKGIQTDLITAGKTFIEGDKNKLKQVLLNLLNNSIDAIEGEGNISIRSELIDERVEITINDDGCGISEKDEEKIFSPFFTTKNHGTGLGLSISKSIIEGHKGELIYSKKEEVKGSVFKVILPIYNHAPIDSGNEKARRK